MLACQVLVGAASSWNISDGESAWSFVPVIQIKKRSAELRLVTFFLFKSFKNQ